MIIACYNLTIELTLVDFINPKLIYTLILLTKMKQPAQADNFIDYSLYTKSLNELPFQSSLLVNTINQYSYCMANEDAGFKESLQMSDVLLPDGISIVAAEYLLTGKKIKKISGADLHHHLLSNLNETAGRCFYLGASGKTLEQIKKKIVSRISQYRSRNLLSSL